MAQQLNISRGTLFLVLITAGIFLQVMPHSKTRLVGYGFQRTFGRILRIGRPVVSPVLSPQEDHDQFVSRDEYNKLVIRYKNTHADLLALQQRYAQLARIRAALPSPGPALVIADVIQTSISPSQRELLINLTGDSRTIKPGQYVLGNDAVIGTIVEIFKSTARIRLITDAKHFIPAGILRDGRSDYVPVQLVGRGDNTCKVPLLSRKDYDIRIGDSVYAMKRTGFLNTPVLLGEITSVKPDETQPLLWNIVMQPACDVENLTHVAIIVMDPPDDSAP